MNDEVSRILEEVATDQLSAAPGGDSLVDAGSFDEAGYLRINADVVGAIRRGEVESGYQHYVSYGLREGRALPGAPKGVRNRLHQIGARAGNVTSAQAAVRHAIDLLTISPEGGLMVIGWIDDAQHPIDCVRIAGIGWSAIIDGMRLVRLRRHDVEEALGGRANQPFGFLGFLAFDDGVAAADACTVEIWLKDETFVSLPVSPRAVDNLELRDLALGYLATCSFLGHPAVEGAACLSQGFGDEIVRFNRVITSQMVASPYVERFGPRSRRWQGSIIVCLYGRSEFLFVQNCLFAGLTGMEDYEFIYVSNSPEMAETLLREARSTSLIYGLSQTLVVLPGNAGFGAANNAAASVARSNRIMMINPDVFPRDLDWAKKHTDLVSSGLPDRTRLFGVPLFYDDGSLMHGGMHFDVEVGLSLADGALRPYPLYRVEHYGKGAPNWAAQYTQARPVPAVTGAFISTERSWFEKLGGFTEDYVYGHYEDADLCLKSVTAGTLPYLQDLRMWHLEGKGSTRLPLHEGGALVNRWLFSRTWAAVIEEGLCGPAPTYPGFEATAPLRNVRDPVPPSFPAPLLMTSSHSELPPTANPSGRTAGSRKARTRGRTRVVG